MGKSMQQQYIETLRKKIEESTARIGIYSS